MVLLSNLKHVPMEEISEDSVALLMKYFTANKLIQLVTTSIESSTSSDVALDIVNSLFFLLERHGVNVAKSGYSELLSFDCLPLLNKLKMQIAAGEEPFNVANLSSTVNTMVQFGQNVRV